MLLLESLNLCLVVELGRLLGVVVLELELGFVGSSLGSSVVGSGLLFLHSGGIGAIVGQVLVYLDEVGHNLVRVVSLPELQVGATLQQLAHTLGLLHTRHFHHDAASLTFQLLDVGLYYAELVDTVAHYVE